MSALSKAGAAALEIVETAAATFGLSFAAAAPTSLTDARAAAVAGVTAGLLAAYKVLALVIPPVGVPRLFAGRNAR